MVTKSDNTPPSRTTIRLSFLPGKIVWDPAEDAEEHKF